MTKDTSKFTGWITYNDGEEAGVKTADVLQYIAANRGKSRLLGQDVLEITPLGGDLIRIDVHMEAIGRDSIFRFEEGANIPLGISDGRYDLDGLRADIPYFAFFHDSEDPSEAARNMLEAELCACAEGAIETSRDGEEWEARGVSIMDETGNPAFSDSVYLTEDAEDGTKIEHTLGEAGLAPERLAAFYNVTAGRMLTFGDLMGGLLILQASVGVAVQMREAKRIDELPRQDTAKPPRQYDPDTKVANLIASPELFGEAGAFLAVAGDSERKRNKSVEIAVSFSVDDGVQLSRPISAYDRDVHRAISSRWVAGSRNITVSQIANDMGIRKPTKNQIRKVEESIELQRRVFGHIDFSEETRNRQLRFPDGTPVTEFVVDGHLIEAKRTTMRSANGQEVKGYHLVDAPLLYQHAAAVGQVVSYPQRWLEFGTGSDTDKHILLRSQLLRQVSRIKNPKWKKSKNIRFTTDLQHPERPCLLSRAGINQKDRHARQKAIEYVISVLDDLKAAGAIKGYELNQQTTRGGKKSTYGVTIKP